MNPLVPFDYNLKTRFAVTVLNGEKKNKSLRQLSLMVAKLASTNYFPVVNLVHVFTTLASFPRAAFAKHTANVRERLEKWENNHKHVIVLRLLNRNKSSSRSIKIYRMDFFLRLARALFFAFTRAIILRKIKEFE